MKISTLLTLGASTVSAINLDPLSYGAFSEPVHSLEVRQAPSAATTIVDALYNIGNATVALNSTISTFTTLQLISLQTASLGLVNTINQAISNVTNAPGNVSLSDATLITVTVIALQSTVNTTITNVIAHKEAFGGASPVVGSSLQQQLTATGKLTAAIDSKLPTALLGEAPKLTQPIFASFFIGIAAFKTPNVNPPSAYVVSGAGSLAASTGILALVAASAAVLLF